MSLHIGCKCLYVLCCAAASRGSGAASVIAALQVITASLTAYPATVTEGVSRPVCATQTQEGASARWIHLIPTVSRLSPPFHGCLVANRCCQMIACLQRNVAGVRCDTCREGSFYFERSNPRGCTSCFCFGATDQCQSSSKRRGKVCLLFRAAARLRMPFGNLMPAKLSGCAEHDCSTKAELLTDNYLGTFRNGRWHLFFSKMLLAHQECGFCANRALADFEGGASLKMSFSLVRLIPVCSLLIWMAGV